MTTYQTPFEFCIQCVRQCFWKGLNAGTGAGRGKRVLPRTPLTKIVKPLNKTIKCDMCKKEFPANVDESVLINHVKTVHMNKKSAEVCSKN